MLVTLNFTQHDLLKIYFPPPNSQQADLETPSMEKKKKKKTGEIRRVCDTQHTVSAFVPKMCHGVTTALNPGFLSFFFYSFLLLLVFLHPEEGLVLWERSWQRVAALFFMAKKQNKTKQSTNLCLL